MSGGQQQRVGIARCIVYSPSIIMMDEPLGALDKNLREQMQDEIKILHRDLGTTFIYVTHDQEEALNMSDRICLVNHGNVVQLGTPDDLYFRPVNRFGAQFITESNLLSGMVDESALRLASGYRLKVPKSAAHIVSETALTVMLRRERIGIDVARKQGDATLGELIYSEHNPGPLKAALRILKRSCGEPLLPLVPAAPTTVAPLKKMLPELLAFEATMS